MGRVCRAHRDDKHYNILVWNLNHFRGLKLDWTIKTHLEGLECERANCINLHQNKGSYEYSNGFFGSIKKDFQLSKPLSAYQEEICSI